MVRYENGDVFDGPESAIIHGCNCFCTMGAGVARQVKERFPGAYTADKNTKFGDKDKLGSFSFSEKDGITIINAYTQYGWATFQEDIPHRSVDYRALQKVMESICQSFDQTEFAMPKIGAGLAHGNWSIIEQILIEVSDKYNKTFVVYEL